MAFLYEKIDALREYGSSAVLPSYIPENLNPNFELSEAYAGAFPHGDRQRQDADYGRTDAVSLQTGISEFLVLCQPFKHCRKDTRELLQSGILKVSFCR